MSLLTNEDLLQTLNSLLNQLKLNGNSQSNEREEEIHHGLVATKDKNNFPEMQDEEASNVVTFIPPTAYSQPNNQSSLLSQEYTSTPNYDEEDLTTMPTILFDGAQYTTIDHDNQESANIIILESCNRDSMQVNDDSLAHVEESESESRIDCSSKTDDTAST